MTTAEAIESMKDAGEFEILATRVLRIEDEDCRMLEHMGVNAAGKTIVNPVDSFCLVPGSEPPRFVMAAFTLEKAESLRRKWLFDHTETGKLSKAEKGKRGKKATDAADGDLIKAARRAKELRKDHPEAKFIVHLCTNKRVDDDLMSDTYKKAKKFDLEARILAQSRIRDCLDVKPEGQWLRKEHLGIRAELLSLSLLVDLSKKSLESYSGEFLITPPESFVTTTSQRMLQESIGSASRYIHIVSGASGCGKSVASFQVFREHVTNGGFGLWISGDVAARAVSLENAIEITLRALYPTIEESAGSSVQNLLIPQRKIVLVIDDINRSGDPSGTLRKILTWGRPRSDKNNENELGSYLIIVPAWTIYWAPLETQFKYSSWLSIVPVERLSADEALRCLDGAMGIRSQAFAEEDRRQFAATLGFDPILIGMFADLINNEPVSQALVIAHETMTRFIDMSKEEAAATGNLLVDDYTTALLNLARCMLLNRKLYPPWEEVNKWLPEQQINAVRQLARIGKICRVIGNAGEQQFEFRHDRILEHHLILVLNPMLAEPADYIEILSDPFYSSFVGHTLASSHYSAKTVCWVRINAPLALVAALRFLNSADRVAMEIVVNCKEWLRQAVPNLSKRPNVFYEACRLLESIDSPIVLEVTEPLRSNPLLSRARLANGDAVAGMIEFASEQWFAPSANARFLDAVLDRALHRYRQKLINECINLLERPNLTEDACRGLLTLCGFIGDAGLSHSIKIAWNSMKNKQSLLIPAIWAACRCGGQDPEDLLGPMLSEWASIPDERENGKRSDRSTIADELRFAMRREISEPILNYLISVAKCNDALHSSIMFLLHHIDHPLVVRFLVEEAAKIEKRAEENGGFFMWGMTLRDQWDPINGTRGHRLSSASLDTLRSCWEITENDPSLKKTAFSFWVQATDDVAILQSIPPEQAGFDKVLRRRAKLGDLTVAPFIKPLLEVDKHWFYFIGPIWCETFKEATNRALSDLQEKTPTDYSDGSTNDHHMLSHLLRDISSVDAEPLLVKHWEFLKYSPLFVQTALYLGTCNSLKMAEEAIQQYPEVHKPFGHVDHFFGFMTEKLRDRLNLKHLESLRPYLKRIGDHAVSSMADFCERHGYRGWSEINLRPEFERRRSVLGKTTREKQEYVERVGRHHFPSDIDLLEELDHIEQQNRHNQFHLSHWYEEFVRREQDHPRWRRILEEWLSISPTIVRLKIAAAALLSNGRRNDLEILDGLVIDGDKNEIDYIIDDTRFGVMLRSLR